MYEFLCWNHLHTPVVIEADDGAQAAVQFADMFPTTNLVHVVMYGAARTGTKIWRVTFRITHETTITHKAVEA